MPDMDGFELASLLRGHEDTKHLPIIFLTAISTEERYIASGYDIGAVDYLSKPFDPKILQSKVRVFVELDCERRQREALILELEQTRDELRASNQELEQFAEVASHDLREPVRAIRQHCRRIRDEMGEDIPEDLAMPLQFAIRGADRVWGMVEGLLEYSRLRSRTITVEPVSITELMVDVEQSLTCAIEEAGGRVTWDELPVVEGDGRLLTRLLQNLISNGLRYHRPDVPPEIHVTACSNADMVTISVEDNGIGIDPEFHDRIFELYRRLHTSGEYPGHGIGLAACLKIARRHDGHIRVESKPDVGSVFHVDLPSSRPTNDVHPTREAVLA